MKTPLVVAIACTLLVGTPVAASSSPPTEGLVEPLTVRVAVPFSVLTGEGFEGNGVATSGGVSSCTLTAPVQSSCAGPCITIGSGGTFHATGLTGSVATGGLRFFVEGCPGPSQLFYSCPNVWPQLGTPTVWGVAHLSCSSSSPTVQAGNSYRVVVLSIFPGLVVPNPNVGQFGAELTA